MTNPRPHPVSLDIAALRGRVRGRVLVAGDDGYDEARVVALGGIDRRPSVIVRVADTADVREVIAVARSTGLELTVRAGGHSGAAHSVVDDGIVLDVRDLVALEIDAGGRTAWAGAGLSAGAYTAAVAEHGDPVEALAEARLLADHGAGRGHLDAHLAADDVGVGLVGRLAGAGGVHDRLGLGGLLRDRGVERALGEAVGGLLRG